MKRILLICFIITAIRANAQTSLYVDSSISASGAGTSWSAAYKTLNEALNVANAASTTVQYIINIAKGTYYPTGVQSATNRDSAFLIARGGVKLYGGFPSGGGARNVSADSVTLSGNIGTATTATDNSYHVMAIAGIASTADSIIIDGLNISGGNANGTGTKTLNAQAVSRNYGGGMCNMAAAGKLVINNCSFSGNAAGGGYGGGIANINSAPAIASCSFRDNIAKQGGGMYNSRTSAAGVGSVISYCTFSGNSATGSLISNGGGLSDISNN
ncbi:MAG: hypothetical protein ABI169_18885, partial [Chitinophagaceae bacterium]